VLERFPLQGAFTPLPEKARSRAQPVVVPTQVKPAPGSIVTGRCAKLQLVPRNTPVDRDAEAVAH